MPLKLNGTNINDVKINGTSLNELKVNGTVVWTKMQQLATPVISLLDSEITIQDVSDAEYFDIYRNDVFVESISAVWPQIQQLATPVISLLDSEITIQDVPDAEYFDIYRNDVFVESISSSQQTVIEYSYTGTIQSATLSSGTYKFECWGASGYQYQGNISYKGGYSNITINITTPTTIYIVVGGVPTNGLSKVTGGYNGGGNSGNYGAAGSGATHIATRNGLLSTLKSYKSDVLIVAGGAGGGGYSATVGGVGGGVSGQQGGHGSATGGAGGTQSGPGSGGGTVGSFGQGGNSSAGGGGGGGLYGGNSGVSAGMDSGGGGGSGYIGGVTNGLTVQTAQNGFIANPDTSGNGFVRISKL